MDMIDQILSLTSGQEVQAIALLCERFRQTDDADLKCRLYDAVGILLGGGLSNDEWVYLLGVIDTCARQRAQQQADAQLAYAIHTRRGHQNVDARV
jgi:hypothetical protein